MNENQPQPSLRAPIGRALVTGASRRVGRATAVEFARAGLDLAITYRTDEAGCRETAALAIDAARAAGFAIAPEVLPLDLCDIASVDRVAAAVERGGVDCIVHNASTYAPAAMGSMCAGDFESLYRAEVVSPALLTQALRGALAQSRLPAGGAVVFYSDIYALGKPRVAFTPYLVAKAAVRALAEQLTVELAPAVRVHCIAPGVIAWPDDDAPGAVSDEIKRATLARTPLARAGTPEEAAKLVRFLVLEASYLTGVTIRIDGGRALR
jgi:pteridine reductase